MNFWGVRKARGQYKKNSMASKCPHLWLKKGESINEQESFYTCDGCKDEFILHDATAFNWDDEGV